MRDFSYLYEFLLALALVLWRGDWHAAEDLVQETMLRLLRVPEPIENPKALAAKIMRAAWVDQRRKRRVEDKSVSVADGDDPLEGQVIADDSEDTKNAQEELAEWRRARDRRIQPDDSEYQWKHGMRDFTFDRIFVEIQDLGLHPDPDGARFYSPTEIGTAVLNYIVRYRPELGAQDDLTDWPDYINRRKTNMLRRTDEEMGDDEP